MNQQLDQLTVAQLAAMLADARRECPVNNDGVPRVTAYDAGGRHGVMCPGCRGIGEVYVLPDSVREPCDGEWLVSLDKCACHGLGYVPPMSLEVWLTVALGLGNFWVIFNGGPQKVRTIWTLWPGGGHPPNTDVVGDGQDVLEALLRALAAGLEAQEIKLEVKP